MKLGSTMMEAVDSLRTRLAQLINRRDEIIYTIDSLKDELGSINSQLSGLDRGVELLEAEGNRV